MELDPLLLRVVDLLDPGGISFFERR